MKSIVGGGASITVGRSAAIPPDATKTKLLRATNEKLKI